LEQIEREPEFARLKKEEGARQMIEKVSQEVALLAMSPKMRIVAVRRRQGAASRRQTAAQSLFTAATEIRRRIKLRYRGPRHAALRKAFGEGMPASAAKPESVLRLAQQVLEAAPAHAAELREVRVGPPTLGRVAGLCERLRASTSDRQEWRTTEQELSQNLLGVAARVMELCDALESAAARLGLRFEQHALAEEE
jgi:hypothetical protein